MRRAAYTPEKRGEGQARSLVLRRETGDRPQFYGNPRQVFRGLVERESPFPRRRVMYYQATPAGGLQDHEMVHVPMQDCRHAQLVEMRQLDAQRAAGQLQMTRRLNETPKRHSLQ